MSEKLLRARILFRRGYAVEWQNLNPVLRSGEPGFEIDTGKIKIGDGKKSWNELPSLESGSSISQMLGSVESRDQLPVKGNQRGDLYSIIQEKALVQWSGESWEDFNTVDLSSYVTKQELQEMPVRVASSDLIGGIKSSSGLNQISVSEDGTATVNQVCVSCLNDSVCKLILNAGSIDA